MAVPRELCVVGTLHSASGQQATPLKEKAEAEGAPRLRPASSPHKAGQEQVKRQSKAVPLVDPPEFGERVQDLYNKDPYWIPAAFPTILQNETGDPYNAPLRPVDLTTWGPHVMRSRGWDA